MPLLFTRFGKLMRTAGDYSDGLGLGLTIVKQIVDACQGSIKVDSAGINKGSCFTIVLPMEIYHYEDDEIDIKNRVLNKIRRAPKRSSAAKTSSTQEQSPKLLKEEGSNRSESSSDNSSGQSTES